jgi:hypothetical protein
LRSRESVHTQAGKARTIVVAWIFVLPIIRPRPGRVDTNASVHGEVAAGGSDCL